MHGMQIETWRTSRRVYPGLALLILALTVFAGCASEGKGKALVANEAPVYNGPSITRLENGREGFIIREVPRLNEKSRKDFDRAVVMLKGRDYPHAIGLLEKVIDNSPGVTAPYIDIAIAYQQTGKPEQAEKYLKTALKLLPDHPAAGNEYGLLYCKTGRFADARAIYEKVLARFPDYYPAQRNLGILCDLYLNDPSCALEHYEIYSKARPDDAQVKLWIADLRTRLGLRQGGLR